ncbi:MAG: SIS domain-containing protein [Bacteroidales bacterium]|nr:SIS domain-containing protein [Bacteroidales bacterium]
MLTLDCHTIREIEHQPKMWKETFQVIQERTADIERFFTGNQIDKSTRIVLTGAGTSAFVADTVACLFMHDGFGKARSVATTDIVSAPADFLSPDDRLFISFARSGNSPESVAACHIARKFCCDARHLIITCNPDGCLAREADPEKDLVIVLPDGTNDRSLAMTSSFSSMLIACLLCKNYKSLPREAARLEAAAAFASRILEDDVTAALKAFTAKDIHRAVFLGSGALKGIACECHLKLQELTDGQIMCSFDSFMGLRHGPKAVVNEQTLVVYLLSDDPYTRRYEYDLIDQVGKENKPAGQIIVSLTPSGITEAIDLEINAPVSEELLAGEYKYVPYVLAGQLLGYFFSLAKGLNPDKPSVRGTISRVVSGVKIYEY